MSLRSFLCSLLVLLGTTAPAWATQELMQELPASGRFGCLICHQTAAPVSNDLNAFGAAFLDNGARWDAALAHSSSDEDGCTNGFELGDENGDGKLDDSVTAERYNPGSDDCPLQINDSAWGELKKLFR